MINKKYTPEYPIINGSGLVPRNQIRLVPEEKLSVFDRAELNQLRKGEVTYRLIVANTLDNRRNIAVKTTYFQMVAYKEGWDFDSEKYQVIFVHPNNPLLGEKGSKRRLYRFDEEATPGEEHPAFRLSREGQVGFEIHNDRQEVTRMEEGETDGLVRKVLRFFTR